MKSSCISEYPFIPIGNQDLPHRLGPSLVDLRCGCKSTPHVNCVIFVVHAIGTTKAQLMKAEALFRETLRSVKTDCFSGRACEVHVEVIDWKMTVQAEQTDILRKIKPHSHRICNKLRDTLNNAASDLIYYSTPLKKQALISDVTEKLNKAYSKLLESDPERFRDAKIAILGFSLGSLIVYDILSSDSKVPLVFHVHSVFTLGSPLAAYLSIQNADDSNFDLHKYVNIYHPLDPFAFRLEPFVYGKSFSGKPATPIPKWIKGRPDLNGCLSLNDEFRGEQNLDFVMQDCPRWFLHQILAGISMFNSHGCYWGNHDVALFILNHLTRN